MSDESTNPMKSKSTSASKIDGRHRSRQALICLSVLAILAAGGFALSTLSITTQITHFLPEGRSNMSTEFSAALTKSELVRTIILSVEAKDKASAAKATRFMTGQLKPHPEIELIESGISNKLTEEVKNLYLDRNLYFLSENPEEELSERFSPEGLRAAVNNLKRQLSLPTATLLRGLITRDPLMSFMNRIEAFKQSSSQALEIVDGQLVTKEGAYGIIFIVTRSSPFKSSKSTLLKKIDTAFLEAQQHGAIKLEQSSVHRFAAASEQSIRADIARISIFSILGITFLFFLLFRNVRYLLMAFVPILVGLASAIIGVKLIFGSVHGITLAFGASMIGVCVDYVVHLYNHHELSESGLSREDSIGEIWPGLRLGAFTTVAGLVGLLLTDLPGTQEIAIFASIGVLSALYATKFVLPEFLRAKVQPSSIQKFLANSLGRGLAYLEGHRAAILAVWLPAILIIVVGLPRLNWDSSMQALNHLDEQLVEEDNRVRSRVFRMENSVIVAAIGDTEESALQVNDRLYPVLKASENISSFRSLHAFLWSKKLQLRNLDMVRNTPDLSARLAEALELEGFKPAPFANAFDHESQPPPLEFADLKASAFQPTVLPFRLPIGERISFLNFVHDVKDFTALQNELSSIKDVFLFDQHRFLAQSYDEYRKRTLQVVPLGLFAVLFLLWFRFRKLRPTLCAFVPAIIAAAASLGLLGILGVRANLLHLVALLLVLSIGVDYGVFVTEHRTPGPSRSATLLSISVACLTTILSFGILAMSQSPALHSLGLSVGVGVFFAVMLAPTALALLRQPGEVND